MRPSFDEEQFKSACRENISLTEEYERSRSEFIKKVRSHWKARGEGKHREEWFFEVH